jgi:hypothetical protein
MSKIVAYIDGERVVFDSDDRRSGSKITLGDKREFILFDSSEEAGYEAREYWEDFAHNNLEEFRYLVGEETLIQWALRQFAGPGSVHVKSLQDRLDLWLDVPEEHFATYDGVECEFESKHPDYKNFKVAYRTS